MEIRQATLEDEAALCDLWKQLLACYKKKSDDFILQRSFRYAVAHPDQVRIYIALINGAVVGSASLHQGHYSTWNDAWYGHVEDVVVNPSYRRQGVGEALVKHIVAVAGELGLCRLELNALNDNERARKMYEKIGFKTDSVVYELAVRKER